MNCVYWKWNICQIKIILTISHKNSCIISCVLIYLLWNIPHLGQLWLHLRQTFYTGKILKHYNTMLQTWEVKQSTSGCLYSHMADQIFFPLTNLMFASKSVSLMLLHIGAKRYTKVCKKTKIWKFEKLWNAKCYYYCDAGERKIVVIVISVSFFLLLKTAFIHGIQKDPVECV